MHSKPYRIGFVVNPISGMGGPVGLKGTDGKNIVLQAIELGAKPLIQERAIEFLNSIKNSNIKILIVTAPGPMGKNACIASQVPHEMIPFSVFRHKLKLYETDKKDTQDALKYLIREKVDIIVFAGGDGTARDVAEVVDSQIPCLGIPGGVKILSSVFAVSPMKGSELIIRYLQGKAPLVDSEVVDIDEDAYRKDNIEARLYGYLRTPHAPLLLQGMKQSTLFSDEEHDNQLAIARTVIENMDPEFFYIFGPGTTVRVVFETLNLEKTLLGFDIVKNRQLIKKDVNEQDILDILKKGKTKLVISPIGKQGFVFGRGNLQLTAEILSKISKENILIICSRSKLGTLPDGCIRTDIRNKAMDEKLRGFYRVLVDYNEYKMIEMI